MMPARAVAGKFLLCNLLLLAAIFFADVAHAMNSEERLLFANGLYRRGLYEMAIPEYNALLTSEAAVQMQDLAAFRLGESYRSLGMTNEAALHYELVISNFPQSVFAHRSSFRRAEIDWLAGRLKDAATRFQKLVENKPPADIEAAALYHLGLSFSGIDRYKDAERNYRRMLSRHPSSPYADYARIALADLLDRQEGAVAEISALLNQVIEKPETPALGAEAAAKAALLAYRQRDMAEASRLFDVLAAMPDNPWVARTRLEAAWSYLFTEKFEKARIFAAEALNAAPKDDRPVWLYLSANIERRAKTPDAATVFYDELLKTAPGHELAPLAAFEACGMAYQRSDYPRVLELVALAAANQDAALPLAWMKAGALRGLGKNAEARLAFEEVVRTFPDSEQAPLAAYQLALLLEEEGDREGSAAAYRDVADTYPDAPVAPDALMASASASLRAGDPASAIAAWNRVIKEHPDHPAVDEAWMGRARAEVALDRDKAAGGTLDQLIKRHPKSRLLAEAHYLRATLYEKTEEPQKAEEHYLLALELKPAAALVRQIQNRRVAVLQRQGRNDDAAVLMNQLLAEGAAGQLPSPLIEWLARWNLEKQSYAEAEAAGRRLAEVGETPAWRQIGWYVTGIAASARKKDGEAREAFAAAAAIGINTRETAEAFYRLGVIALAEKKAEEAIAHFTRAAELSATDAWMDIRARSYLQLGVAHESLGKWADAGRYYLGVGVLFDDPLLTPESLYRAAGALHAQQQNRERDRVIDELRERFPDTDWTTRAEERWGEKKQDNL